MRKYETDVVELRKIMAEKGINTIVGLSELTGVNRNTLGKVLDGTCATIVRGDGQIGKWIGN